MAVARSPISPADGYIRFDDELVNAPSSYGSNNINLPLNSNASTLGSRSSLNQLGGGGRDDDPDDWEMNYYEAAIYLEEGRRNEKFDAHPRHASALPAYRLVHSAWYHAVDLSAAVALLVLAVAEEPSVPQFHVPIAVHGVLELLNLTVIGIMLALKLRWIGWKSILSHKRTMIKGGTLAVMVVEALVVIFRSSSHFRVTRALRPMFLVDCRACGGVRRFVRQVLQSLPPILDMLGLLLFFICIYSLLGFYLFAGHLDSLHFKTLGDSFVSMFVLLTTANFPDVMMPSFAQSQWYAIFFVSYLAIVLYVLMNLMLAVVYEAFTRIERDKFRALLLHKRKACEYALPLLNQRGGRGIKFAQFQGCMRHYAPEKTPLEALLMFLSLNTSNSGVLSENEWLAVYENCSLRWCAQGEITPWFHHAPTPIQVMGQVASDIVHFKYFEHIIYFIIAANGAAMLFRLAQGAELIGVNPSGTEEAAMLFAASWDSALFLALYTIEALLRITALGMYTYLRSGWNVFDCCVTVWGVLGALLLRADPALIVLVVLRPLRLLRLYKLKKRYRDVFGTLVLLSPLMCSAALVMLVLYYFYAIIGMELFSGYDMRNCCINSTVEDFYRYSANATTPLGYYYLNTFDNLMSSSLTLFELTVVNNWFVIMNGYAYVAGQYSRLYFMCFYLSTMIVLTIVVASVLEAFRFRIQYKRSTSKRDEEIMLHEEVHVNWSQLPALLGMPDILEDLWGPEGPADIGGTTSYTGSRPRTREVLQRRMYSAEIKKWFSEAEPKQVTGTISQRTELGDGTRLIGV